jgi:HEAT repeat protein
MRILTIFLLVLLSVGCSKEKKHYSVEQMIEDLKNPDHNVRYTAAEVLGDYGPQAKSAVPALREALADSDRYVRMRAAYSLAEIRPDAQAAIPELTKALKDKEKYVREAAAYALKRLQKK